MLESIQYFNFAVFPTVDELFPTVSGVLANTLHTFYLYPITDVPAVVGLPQCFCWHYYRWRHPSCRYSIVSCVTDVACVTNVACVPAFAGACVGVGI
jgi:hypothetical protein